MKIFVKSFLIFVILSEMAFASTSVGTVDTTSKYTKICKDNSCSSYGNINMKPTINANTPGATAVTITDTGITGHAWGDEIGWINFTPTGSGVTVNPNTGLLGGMAYSQNGGWINFSVTGQSVSLVDNGSGSNFSGWAYVSGLNGGWIKFDCGSGDTCIKTDWRTIPNRTVIVTPSGGGGGGGYIPPTNTQTDTNTPTVVPVVKTEDANKSDATKPAETEQSTETNNNPIDVVTDFVKDIFVTKDSEQTPSEPLKVVAGLNPETPKPGEAGVYKPLFSYNRQYSPTSPDCTFCLVLRKEAATSTVKLLKWNFIPVRSEVRLKTSVIVPIVSKPVPDIDLTSLVITTVAASASWKYLIYGIIRRLIIKG